MEFEWDEKKREQVLQKHGIDFEEVKKAFSAPYIDDEDPDHSHTENRRRMIGWVDGRVVVVVYTERNDRIRLITARHANRQEELLYYQEFFGDPY